jgi:hypothetical protein
MRIGGQELEVDRTRSRKVTRAVPLDPFGQKFQIQGHARPAIKQTI